MRTENRLDSLLDRWVAEADAGRLLPVAELCRDCPDLLAEAEQQIAVLRRFHALARPSASTSVAVQAGVETTTGEPALDFSLDQLPTPGTKFGRYQIRAELGKGGMGVVYHAHDTQLGRDVALKVVRPDMAANPITSGRFLREARALAAIRNDHVVEIYDYGELNGACFVTMPLLAGEPLETRLQRQSPLPLDEVQRIGTELAAGLAAVHAKGLIHRDLKPSNVWLEASHGRVKLLDFGLARDPKADDRVTRTGAVVGTPAYMSPEQVNGQALDARSDLFSLGSILYKAATGRAAFAGASLTATLKAVGEDHPPPAQSVNATVPTGLSDLIERLHEKNPADRPASAAEVAEALRAFAIAHETPTKDWQASLAKGEAPKPSARRLRFGASVGIGRFRLRIALTVGIVALAVVMLGSLYSRFGRPRSDSGPTALPDSAGNPPVTSTPLRVTALNVLHAEAIDDKNTHELRTLGKDSFGAGPDDDIKVEARLSRPAYCYLIVFRADGKHEVLYPQSPTEAPELTDQPRYPSKDRGKVYGLSDGVGLWLIALVASDKPLPPFSEWRKQHPGGPWAKSAGKPNVVWFDDGGWVEEATPYRVRTRGERGEKKDRDAAPIVAVVDWLKAETGGTVSAVAFTVETKK